MAKSPNPWVAVPIAGAIMGGLWGVGLLGAYSSVFSVFSHLPLAIILALPTAAIGALLRLLICAIWQLARCISRWRYS